jgi:hypothetical protein
MILYQWYYIFQGLLLQYSSSTPLITAIGHWIITRPRAIEMLWGAEPAISAQLSEEAMYHQFSSKDAALKNCQKYVKTKHFV